MNVHDGHAAKKEGHQEFKQNIFMPNEIFDDLHNAMGTKKASHIAFAYSYYYFITYLYRYSMYGMESYTQSRIKSELGFNAKYKEVDYIIKKGGVLDQIGYTRTTTDYPVLTITERELGYDFNFMMKSELDLSSVNDRNFKIKYPIKAFYREAGDDYLSGTFYETANTHKISIETFSKAMQAKGIGCDGFYLFALLKMKNETHSHLEDYKGGYYITIEILSKLSKIKTRTLYPLIEALEANGFISVKRDQSLRSKKSEYKSEPNIYFILLD